MHIPGLDEHLDNYGDPDPRPEPDTCPVCEVVMTEETEAGEPACANCGWIYHAVCCYSAAHTMSGVPSVTVIDCGPVGMIPACQGCADFYTRNTR
jgi:hypothetical protein